MASPIKDYALLSNMQTGPLVSRRGSVDWLCLPRFDSPSACSALLGSVEDGRWVLAPAATVDDDDVDLPEPEWTAHARVGDRFYAENTFVLHTVWITDTGSVRVTDFMPLTQRSQIVRRVEGLTGEVEMFQELRLRFGYGKLVPWVSEFEGAVDAETGEHSASELIALCGPDSVVFRGDPMPQGVGDPVTGHPRHTGRFTIAAGQTRDFTLTHFPSYASPPAADDVDEQLRHTLELWREWDEHWQPEATDPDDDGAPGSSAERPRQDGEEMSRRSLLVLRALMHRQTSGLVAAPTTSLPEVLGGERNWDSRYCWLRDACAALEVMLDHGHDREALQLRNWLLRAVAGDPEMMQNIYGLAGERCPAETSVDLSGFERSRPVRVGNSTSRTFQADTAGYLLVAFEKLRLRGLEEDRLSWPLQQALVEFVVRHFEDQDHGLWEMRGDKEFYTHSRVMMWAGLQAGVDAVVTHGLEGDLSRWESYRDQLAMEIWRSGFDPAQGTFVQAYGSSKVDASLLQLPEVGFVAWDDPRMVATVEAITAQLDDGHGMLRRYRNIVVPEGVDAADFESQIGQDGLSGQDAAHTNVTLWLAVHWARSGQVERARAIVDRVLERANDLGLLSIAYQGDPRADGVMLGNMPHVLPHITLIQALDAIHDAQAAAAADDSEPLDDPARDPRPAVVDPA